MYQSGERKRRLANNIMKKLQKLEKEEETATPEKKCSIVSKKFSLGKEVLNIGKVF